VRYEYAPRCAMDVRVWGGDVTSGLVLGVPLAVVVVFAIARVAKLADRESARRAPEGFGVPARLAGFGAVVLPAIELAVAVWLLVGTIAWWGPRGAVRLMVLFVGAMGVSIVRGAAPDRHCFGQLQSKPAGGRAFVRNIPLAAGVGAALAGGPSVSQRSPVAIVDHLTAVELAFAAVAVVLIGVVAAEAWFRLELLYQHGRIPKRLQALQRGPASGGAPASVLPAAANGASGVIRTATTLRWRWDGGAQPCAAGRRFDPRHLLCAWVIGSACGTPTVGPKRGCGRVTQGGGSPRLSVRHLIVSQSNPRQRAAREARVGHPSLVGMTDQSVMTFSFSRPVGE
jgi:hypothetical protein